MLHFWNWRSPYGIQHSFVNVSGKKHPNGHSRHNKENQYNSKTIADEVDKARIKLEQEFQNETIQEMIHNIIDFIPKCHLKREFYPNKPDWSNEEINNLINHSPADIENRSWVFYMNPCISQTLYTINRLKEEFPDFDTNLWIEFLEYETGLQSAHVFIQIRPNIPGISPEKSIIIDYSRSNDICIYEWKYKNDTIGIKPNSEIMYISSKIFKSDYNIFLIAKEAWLEDDKITGFKKNLGKLQNHLCNENKWWKEKYDVWKSKHGDSPIYCLSNWKDEKWYVNKRQKFKIENWDKKIILIENWEDNNWGIIWAELHVENLNPLGIYIENDMWKKQYIQDKLEKNIQNFIQYTLYCK